MHFAYLAYHLNTEEYLKAKGDVRCIHKIAERLVKKFMEMISIIPNIKDLIL
jgi:hypothetical protein